MQIIPDPMFATLMMMPFIVAVFAYHFILVQPLRQYLEGRDAAISGARKEAGELDKQAEAALEKLEAKLAVARQDASGIKGEARQRGLKFEQEAVAKARQKADAQLEEAIAAVKADADVAAAALKDSAQALSQDIAAQVLGRSVSA